MLRPLDPKFPIERQIAIAASPVVLVNVFTLDKADEEIFLSAWQNDAAFMKRQPGFISTQLHRGRSATARRISIMRSGIDRRLRASVHPSGVQGGPLVLPASAVASPHLFQKVAVPESASPSRRELFGA